MSTAVCPGTFDPITLGHLDIIVRAANLYDKVVVAVVATPEKETLFSLEERVQLARQAVAGLSGVEVTAFDDLLVKFAHGLQATVIVKGLRAISDFEREFQMAHLNRKLAGDIDTVFLMASPEFMFLSSSAVKEIASYNGSVAGLVPNFVEQKVYEKYGPRRE